MNNYSILRAEEYRYAKSLFLNGKILDIGGSRKSGYHELIQGSHSFTVINIDKKCKPDVFVDIEKKFPFQDDEFDHAICFNVLEHIFEYENVISETVRTVRQGGTIVVAIPMLHHIHASPNDYFRYTESALRRLFEKHGCEVNELHKLGAGFFSLGFQSIGGALPTNFLRITCKQLATSLDNGFSKISKKYKKLSDSLPLGYFVIAEKRFKQELI